MCIELIIRELLRKQFVVFIVKLQNRATFFWKMLAYNYNVCLREHLNLCMNHLNSALRKRKHKVTCLKIDTAVVPLHMQSMNGWLFKSVSISSKARTKIEFHELSLRWSHSWTWSIECVELSSAYNFDGRVSLTRDATWWPKGPCPSNTPQKIWLLSPPMPYAS